MRKAIVRNCVSYAIAAAIVCYAARGVSWRQVAGAGSHAALGIFAIASLGGFLCWFIGETVLYSRLFSYFHAPTGEVELLPTMAAVYFLQIVNSYLASGAFVLFLHARKRVPWLMGGCTLLFQGYLDATLLATLSLLAIALVPTSPIRLGLNYAAGMLGASCLIASFWLVWGARLKTGNWLRWIYERPSMVSFRIARTSHYIKLLSIRFLIVLGSGLALYGQFVSFHIEVPLMQTLALTPFHCGNRKFAILTRRNRNDAVGLHLGVCPVCRQRRSVRAVPGCYCIQPPGPDTDGTSDGSAAGGRSGRGQERICDQTQGWVA